MLALDAKIEQITEADQGALQKPQDQKDKVSSKINLMELQMFKSGGAVFGYSDLEHGNQDNSADPDGKCSCLLYTSPSPRDS